MLAIFINNYFVKKFIEKVETPDMPDGIQSTVRLFADDTIAYVTISSDADNLQQDLDKLAEWESKWLMFEDMSM
jgi:hypothetical protein